MKQLQCEHCGNPIKEFHRTQCMWLGAGTPPCEIEKYESDRHKTRIGCYLMMMIWAGVVFAWWLIWR
jgi:hypothetical protein